MLSPSNPAAKSDARLVSADGDRLTPKRKLLFSAAEPINGWTGWVHENLYNPIFVQMFGVTPTVLSLIVGFFRIFDAFINPVMGWISDSTKSRWGRRRPYILLGSILSGLWISVAWWLPYNATAFHAAAWLAVTGIVMTIFATMYNVPYQTLAIEMTSGIKERTSVGAYRAYAGKAGNFVAGWVFALIQLPIFNNAAGQTDKLNGARWVFMGLGVVIIALGTICACCTPERQYQRAADAAHTPRVSLWASFKMAFGSKPFVRMAIITLSFATGAFLVTQLKYFVKLNYVMNGDEKLLGLVTGLEGTYVTIAGILGIPLFQFLSNRLGKHNSLLIALGSVFVGSLLTWFIYIPGHPYLTLIVPVLTSPALTAIWVIVPSMNADIIDEAELINGVRRDGAFASVYSWVVKLSMSGAYMLSGPIVDATGFNAQLFNHQADGVILNMRLCLALVPAVTLLPALWLLWRYPLGTERVREIQTELVRRRGTLGSA